MPILFPLSVFGGEKKNHLRSMSGAHINECHTFIHMRFSLSFPRTIRHAAHVLDFLIWIYFIHLRLLACTRFVYVRCPHWVYILLAHSLHNQKRTSDLVFSTMLSLSSSSLHIWYIYVVSTMAILQENRVSRRLLKWAPPEYRSSSLSLALYIYNWYPLGMTFTQTPFQYCVCSYIGVLFAHHHV